MSKELKRLIIRASLFVCTGAFSIGSAFYIASIFVKDSSAKLQTDEPPNPFLAKEILIAQNTEAPGTLPQPPAAGSDAAPVEEKKTEDYELFLEPYNYDPSGRRDPFVRIENLEGLNVAGVQSRPLLPLERYSLGEIELIGIIWSVKNPRAMFLDPEQKVHVLGKDERIGRNQGYIAVIREGEVVVVESTEKSGEVVYQTKVMRLRSEQIN